MTPEPQPRIESLFVRLDSGKAKHIDLAVVPQQWLEALAMAAAKAIEAQGYPGKPANKPRRLRGLSMKTLEGIAIGAEMRLAGETLEAIGSRLDVTREWARQLLLYAAKRDPAFTERLAAAEAARQPAPTAADIQGRLSLIVKRWLAECGWRWCSCCKLFLCSSDFYGKTPRCKTCSVARQRTYAAEHPEQMREYARRNNAKQGAATKERYKEKLRADPERLAAAREKVRLKRLGKVATPEGLKKEREAARLAYTRMTSTPEGREKLRQRGREKYARKRDEAAGKAAE